MKRLLGMSAILFSLWLALPLFQMLTGWPRDYALQGAEGGPRQPAASFAAWWNGSLQSDIDAWMNKRVGLRGFLVRTANQVNFSLFRELPRRRGTQVLMGRQGFLFEKVYVDAYNAASERPMDELRDVSASTRRLQDRLAADGIAFVLVIAPSKAEVYPEHLPARADVAGRADRRSTYQNMIGLLQADGVNLVDAHALFCEWKREPGAPPLFARGGTHWNDYGAARVVAELTGRLRSLTGKDVPVVHITGAVTNRTIVGADNDLAELLNLWSARPLAGPQVHPVPAVQAGSCLPDVLFVGDSFVFTLTNVMDRLGLYRKRETYYYYNRRYVYPEAPSTPLDKRQLDLLTEVRGRDAIVVEVGEYWLPRIGFGFVRDLLRAYDAEDAGKGAGAPAS